jgi:pSer/pThr/pTyr-binding forkhead associated (FHA) protein
MPVLRVRKGKNEGEAYAVFSRKDPTVLGRGEETEVCLDDSRCSRKHAHVLLASGNWLIQDLGSSNGTLLNGEKVDKGRLQDQATIQIGNSLLVFEEKENLPPPRREIYGARLLETEREEGGVFVYHAYQAALDRALRIDLFAGGQAPTGKLLDRIQDAVKSTASLKHDHINAVVTSEFSDTNKSYLVLKSHGGSSLEDELAGILAEPLAARLDLVRQLLLITLARQEIPGICFPMNLTQLQVQAGTGAGRVLSTAALELPTLLGFLDGSLRQLSAYTNYLPPELSEDGCAGAAQGEKTLAYSIAAISYHLLTGAPAMGQGETREILEKHRELKPAPANLIDSNIPEEISDLLGRMLEKDPAQRPSVPEEIDPVISSLAPSTEVVEIQDDYQPESEPADRPQVSVTQPPRAGTGQEPKPVISRTRLESPPPPRPSMLQNLISLPFWAALWAALFYGSSKVAELLFAGAAQ